MQKQNRSNRGGGSGGGSVDTVCVVQIKLFSSTSRQSLQKSVNGFLKKIEKKDVQDIKYQCGVSVGGNLQAEWYEAMIIYTTYVSS
jgi:hypothetical protein